MPAMGASTHACGVVPVVIVEPNIMDLEVLSSWVLDAHRRQSIQDQLSVLSSTDHDTIFDHSEAISGLFDS